MEAAVSTEPKVEPKPEPKPEPKISHADAVAHPAFLGLKKQMLDATAALDAIKAEQEKAVRDGDEKKLAEQNNWAELKKRTETELTTLKAQHAAELLRLQADAALSRAGLNHDVTRDGYVHRYVATDPGARQSLDEWVAAIRDDEANSIFFRQHGAPLGAGPASKASPGGSSATPMEQLKRDLNGTDRKLAAEARTKARQMIDAGTAKPGDFAP